MYYSNSKSFFEHASSNLAEFSEYSTASENFAAAIGQIFDEESSISSFLGNSNRRARDEQIRRYIDEGVIDEEVANNFTHYSFGGKRVNYDGIAEYANENLELDTPIKTAEELFNERNEDLASRRKYRERVFDTSLTGGKVNQFAGMLVGASLDPVMVATMPIAVSTMGARNLSKAMYSLSMAKRTALFGMATAAPIEPFIHSWKEEIGAEYTLADSMFNLGAAGLLSGSIGGAVGYLAHGARTRLGLIKDLEDLGLDTESAEIIADQVDELKRQPDQNQPAEEYYNIVEETQERMDTQKGTHDKVPDLDTNDQVQMAEMETNIREDLTFVDTDGNTINYKKYVSDIDEESKRVEEILGCLNGS